MKITVTILNEEKKYNLRFFGVPHKDDYVDIPGRPDVIYKVLAVHHGKYGIDVIVKEGM